jgi:hypothetical protein
LLCGVVNEEMAIFREFSPKVIHIDQIDDRNSVILTDFLCCAFVEKWKTGLRYCN